MTKKSVVFSGSEKPTMLEKTLLIFMIKDYRIVDVYGLQRSFSYVQYVQSEYLNIQ